jgi:hypothetical protein
VPGGPAVGVSAAGRVDEVAGAFQRLLHVPAEHAVTPALAVSPRDTPKRTMSVGFDGIAPPWLHRGVTPRLRLHRRSSVDLLRVASALCPGR